MTPMIDVTFLLIVFFVVVSQIVDRDAVPMDLPAPEHAIASIPEQSEHVVVNLVSQMDGDGTIATIVVGGHSIEWGEMEQLTAIVKTRLQGGAKDVFLRADKATEYVFIHQAIEAIRKVGTTPRLQLMVSGDTQ